MQVYTFTKQNDVDSSCDVPSFFYISFQTMNLKNNEFEWLLNHLGHTGDVHKQHYRQMSGLVERVYISKLLLIQDLNLTNKFPNQDLVEMDIRGKSLIIFHFI